MRFSLEARADSTAETVDCCPQGSYQPGLLHRLLHPRCFEGGPPVARESWIRRPLEATWMVGIVQGSPVISDWLNEKQGIFGGIGVGWDFSDYWGSEVRLRSGTFTVSDSDRAVRAQEWADAQNGFTSEDPWWHRFDGGRNGDMFLYDINLLFYPWGDTTWRPYALVGVGGTRLSVMDRLSQSYDLTLFTLPLGLGLKYHFTDWMALRAEVADNIGFGAGGVNTLHNLSIVGAAELRFGGSRRSYWPWIPGRRFW